MHTHLDMCVHSLERLKRELDQKALATGKDYPLELLDVPEIARRSVSVGINGFLHCACELDGITGISKVLDDIQSVDGAHVYGAVALHPNETVLHAAGKGGDSGLLQRAEDGLDPPKVRQRHEDYDLDEAIAKVYEVAKSDARIKVIGETGLDYFRSAEVAKGVQKYSFQKHIDIAKELGLALQIHDRDAHQDVLDTLSQVGAPERVLFHSFSGDVEMAKVCAEQGWYTSFSGPVTFNPNDELRAALRYIWEEAPHLLLIETDAPFLTPAPHRGRTNIPAMIPYTLRFIAEFLGVPLLALLETIAANEARVLIA
jgi:TatD DNase family protein